MSGANAVAAKAGAVVAAGAALAAALGGKAGVPGWLRIVFVALALVVAIMVVVLTLFEQTAGPRARVRRRRDWVEDHFEPHGRGVARKSEPGAYFTGRTRALGELVAWLGTNRGGLCVVTGDPGSGKSAVLGRLVALVDPKRWRELGITHPPAATVPPEGSIDLTVWARGLTMGELIEEIAATIETSATTPDGLIDAIVERGRGLVVVIDALDEASGEGEARRIAQRLLKPLAATGRSIDVKVVVGTRRGPGNELLDALGAAKQVLNLDTPDYLDRADLVQYVRRRLLREGETDARTPYRAQPALAAHVAEAVAARADPSFLIAQLVSATLAAAPAVSDTSQPGWENQFAADVGSAMDDYLDRFETERDRRRARDLLTALAYAEGAGLPRDQSDNLWPLLASALAAKPYDGDDIDWVLQTAAADLVDHTMANGSSTCRLFHQALDEHLRGPAEQQRNRQRALAGTLEATVPQAEDDGVRDWSHASPYVRTHLATHAAAAGVLDPLVEDPGYLLAADPGRLLLSLASLTAPAACAARRVYRHAFDALRGSPAAERASYLEMAARQAGADDLAEQLARRAPTRPWSARWARWQPAAEHFIAGRHNGGVGAVAFGELDGRAIALTGSWDGTVRVWDLATATQRGDPLTGHDRRVEAAAFGELDGRAIALTGGSDGTVRIFDLAANGGSTLVVGSPVHAIAFTPPSETLVGANAGLMLIELAPNV